jgi:hypothetical protein
MGPNIRNLRLALLLLSDIIAGMAPPKILSHFDYTVGKWIEGLWSRHHDECRRCHNRQIPHHAQGYCKSCYQHLKVNQPRRAAQRDAEAQAQKPCGICRKNPSDPMNTDRLCTSCHEALDDLASKEKSKFRKISS